jgi:molybdenum-dependent DNA-binding transcriptional regulator ModE
MRHDATVPQHMSRPRRSKTPRLSATSTEPSKSVEGHWHLLIGQVRAGGHAAAKAQATLRAAVLRADGDVERCADALRMTETRLWRLLREADLLDEAWRVREGAIAPGTTKRDPSRGKVSPSRSPEAPRWHWLTKKVRAGGQEAEDAKATLRETMISAGGDVAQAADALGMSTLTLWRLTKRLNMLEETWEVRRTARARRKAAAPQKPKEVLAPRIPRSRKTDAERAEEADARDDVEETPRTAARRGKRHPLTQKVRVGGASEREARIVLRRTMVATGGEVERASQRLGMSVATLWRLLKHLELLEEAWEIRRAARAEAKSRK